MAYSLTASSGTISIADGGTSVTGVDTAFAMLRVEGGFFVCEAGTGAVASVQSDTQLTLEKPLIAFAGTSGGAVTGGDYLIYRGSSNAADAVRAYDQLTLFRQLVEQITVSALTRVSAFGADLAGRDAYDDEWLDVDGNPFVYAYVDSKGTAFFSGKKSATSGDWSDPFNFNGPAGLNGENGAATDHSDSGVPSNGLGTDGQTYADIDNGDTYLKASGTWVLTGSIRGPRGERVAFGSSVTAYILSGDAAVGDLFYHTGNGNVYSVDALGGAGAGYTLVGRWRGLDGADGLGVPAGGTTGQFLAKASGTDNDTEWRSIPTNYNHLINGDGRFNQRSASSGLNNDSYGHDRHYALTQTASITVSTLNNIVASVPYMMRLAQDNASAQRMGYAQILEASQTYGLRGKTVTLGGKFRYSNAAAIRFAVLEWTGAADVVTSNVIADWTNGTFTAGNFFRSTDLIVRQVGTITPGAATVTDFQLVTTIGLTAKNIIVFMWTETAAAQNTTLDINWYLSEGDLTGSTALPIVDQATEYVRSRRFYRLRTNPSGFASVILAARAASLLEGGMPIEPPMRATPTFSYAGTPDIYGIGSENLSSLSGFTTPDALTVRWTDTGTPFSTGNGYTLGGVDIVLDAEL